MNLLESVASGLASIWSHKLRSSLTLVGIVVGVASVIAMFSFVGGIVTRVREDFEQIGFDNTFFVGNMDPMNPEGRASLKVSKGLMLHEMDVLEAEVPEIRGITPVVAAANDFLALVGFGQVLNFKKDRGVWIIHAASA